MLFRYHRSYTQLINQLCFDVHCPLLYSSMSLLWNLIVGKCGGVCNWDVQLIIWSIIKIGNIIRNLLVYGKYWNTTGRLGLKYVTEHCILLIELENSKSTATALRLVADLSWGSRRFWHLLSKAGYTFFATQSIVRKFTFRCRKHSSPPEKTRFCACAISSNCDRRRGWRTSFRLCFECYGGWSVWECSCMKRDNIWSYYQEYTVMVSCSVYTNDEIRIWPMNRSFLEVNVAHCSRFVSHNLWTILNSKAYNVKSW